MGVTGFRVSNVWPKSPYYDDLIAISSKLQLSWVSFFLNERPSILYHYTTPEGVIGILSSNRLWATDIRYLNDSSELLYAYEITLQELHERGKESESQLINTLIEQVQSALHPSNKENIAYVACFCEKGDLLSQWRAYGNHVGGYAVGFQADRMKGSQFPPLFQLKRVIYKPEIQRSLIRDVINEVCDLLETVTKGETQYDGSTLINVFGHFLDDHLSELLPVFKSPAFEEECEWRAVFDFRYKEQIDSIRFRAAYGNVIPFIDLDIAPFDKTGASKLPIIKIIHGPAIYPELTKKSLSLLAKRHGFDSIEIEGSSIPLRF